MVHRASRDRQSSTRRSWTTARSASKALARAEVRGGAGGSSQTMKPSSESRGHQASTSKSWTTARGAGRARAIAEARGSTNRSSQTIIASLSSGPRDRQGSTSRNWTTASMAAKLWRERRGEAAPTGALEQYCHRADREATKHRPVRAGRQRAWQQGSGERRGGAAPTEGLEQ